MSTKKSVVELQQELESNLRFSQDLHRQGVASATDERWIKASEDRARIQNEMEIAVESEKIDRQLIALQAEQERGKPAQSDNPPQKKPETRDMSYDGVFNRWLVRGKNATLPEDEMRLLETRGTNTQIVTTNSLGGYLVPQEFSRMLEMYGIWKGGMLEAAGMHESQRGGQLRWPTGDDTSTNGEIVGQGVARTVQDMTFGNVLFNDYTIDSGIVKMGREFVNDEDVKFLQSVLAEQLAQRIRRKVNSVLTNGTGTSEPYGLTVSVTATGTTTVASATGITKGELVKHLYSVDKYYSEGPKVGWMMHRNTLGYLRTLDFSTDTTHLFADIKAEGETERLLGYPVFINNDLPDLSGGLPVAATKHIYFGDFSKYVVRRIDGISIERNDNVYWVNHTVGYMGWTRLDGNLIIQGAIKPLLQKT